MIESGIATVKKYRLSKIFTGIDKIYIVKFEQNGYPKE